MLVCSLGQLPSGAIVLAAQPEEQVVENQPKAVIPLDVGIHVVAADQAMPELLETGNTRKLT